MPKEYRRQQLELFVRIRLDHVDELALNFLSEILLNMDKNEE